MPASKVSVPFVVDMPTRSTGSANVTLPANTTIAAVLVAAISPLALHRWVLRSRRSKVIVPLNVFAATEVCLNPAVEAAKEVAAALRIGPPTVS